MANIARDAAAMSTMLTMRSSSTEAKPRQASPMESPLTRSISRIQPCVSPYDRRSRSLQVPIGGGTPGVPIGGETPGARLVSMPRYGSRTPGCCSVSPSASSRLGCMTPVPFAGTPTVVPPAGMPLVPLPTPVTLARTPTVVPPAGTHSVVRPALHRAFSATVPARVLSPQQSRLEASPRVSVRPCGSGIVSGRSSPCRSGTINGDIRAAPALALQSKTGGPVILTSPGAAQSVSTLSPAMPAPRLATLVRQSQEMQVLRSPRISMPALLKQGEAPRLARRAEAAPTPRPDE